MRLPDFIINPLKEKNTSIGNNKALPEREDVAFEYLLIKKRYKDVIAATENLFGELPGIEQAETTLSKLIAETMAIERPLRPQLEKLCQATVTGVLAVPQETVLLDCTLTDKVEPETELRFMPEYDDDPEYTFDDVDEIYKMNAEVMKRRLIDAIVQGVSYCLMSDTFNSRQINEWDARLSGNYEKIITLNDYLLFSKQEKISQRNPMLGAYVETHLGRYGEKTVISSQGLVYPLLLQETYRGFFELFASHGLPESNEMAKYVIKKADFLVAEAWDLRIGVPLWERIGKNATIKSSMLPYIFASIVQNSTGDFNKLMQNILANTAKGKAYIEDIIRKVKHDEEYNTFKRDIERFNIEKCLITDEVQ